MGLFKNIKEGWGNYLTYFYTDKLPPEIIEMAEKRAEICTPCPSLKKSKVMTAIETIMPDGRKTKKLVNGGLVGEKVQGYVCGECGCGWPAMLFSPDKKCKINKW